jgi:hypothetical protein
LPCLHSWKRVDERLLQAKGWMDSELKIKALIHNMLLSAVTT